MPPEVEKPIVAPTFLYRFRVPCQHVEKRPLATQIELPAAYRIPTFGELEDRPFYADVRMGWNAAGLDLSVRVSGKKQPPWCRASRMEDSDGLSVWIDTRATHNVHRATRFCHWFVFLPQGNETHPEQPVARLVDIPRARENPKPVASHQLEIRSEKRIDGYVLGAHIEAAALTGYDPDQMPELGFSYAVIDRELGWQTFTVGSEFPITADPSLWGTLELLGVRSK